jgi:hypothetical protein
MSIDAFYVSNMIPFLELLPHFYIYFPSPLVKFDCNPQSNNTPAFAEEHKCDAKIIMLCNGIRIKSSCVLTHWRKALGIRLTLLLYNISIQLKFTTILFVYPTGKGYNLFKLNGYFRNFFLDFL